VKLATVLEECTTEDQSSFVRFLWAKGLSVEDIHKEMFPVYAGKCLSRKTCLNAMETSQFTYNEKVQVYAISSEGYVYSALGFSVSTISPFSEAR
jgi:hypothetical protein